jgi:hypothetical protein
MWDIPGLFALLSITLLCSTAWGFFLSLSEFESTVMPIVTLKKMKEKESN